MRTCLIILSVLIWKTESYQISNYIKIDGFKYNGSSNEIIYKSKILLSKQSRLVITINGLNYDNYGFSIVQAHCLYHNISMSLEKNDLEKDDRQYGTNLGFMLKPNESKKSFRISNDNFDDVQCLIALIAYTKLSPLPSNCEMGNSTNIEMIKLVDEGSFLTAIIPKAMEPNISCESSNLTYETFYTYLDMLNFGADAYFEGIEKMIFDGVLKTFQTKQVPLDNLHLLETIPGRGLIINTVVKGHNGSISYNIPVATYSCPPNTWSTHCTDTNFIKRGITIVLLVHSIVMVLNLMAPDFIESILNGMLFGGFITMVFIESYSIEMQTFDYFITVIIGSFFVSALFGTITLYMPIGRFLTKFTFSLFVATFVMEIFLDTIVSGYLQLIIASSFSIVLSFTSITYSVFLGCLILIMNASYLARIGNLHRIVTNNYLALTTMPPESANETYFDFIRPNYINYKMSLNILDYGMIVFYVIMSIYLTIRKERFFFGHPSLLVSDNIFSDSKTIRAYNCEVAKRRKEQHIIGIRRSNQNGGFRIVSRCRRHLSYNSTYVNERSPLIAPWHYSPMIDEREIFYTPPERTPSIRIKASSDEAHSSKDVRYM